jgi:hypothetical protein
MTYIVVIARKGKDLTSEKLREKTLARPKKKNENRAINALVIFWLLLA